MVDPTVTDVWVKHKKGDWNLLFTFYPDEISFDADEFVGLSDKKALDLRKERDHEYFIGDRE